jgi:hypothetical protein
MASPSEKLAQSLEVLRGLQKEGIVAIRSRDLTRTHRERLAQNGFLQEVIKGWYIAARPDEMEGESTAWYNSFWAFCAAYLLGSGFPTLTMARSRFRNLASTLGWQPI